MIGRGLADSLHPPLEGLEGEAETSAPRRHRLFPCSTVKQPSATARILWSAPGKPSSPSVPSPGGKGESSPAKSARERRAKRRVHSLCACIVADARRLSARLWRRSHYGAGPRFRRALRPASGLEFAAPSGSTARSEPRASLDGPPSASSSQGLVVVPGGAPAPPGCVACEPRPRAPRPLPLPDAS